MNNEALWRFHRISSAATIVLFAGWLFAAHHGATNPQTTDHEALDQFNTLKESERTDYAPALARIDPTTFGVTLITIDGKVYIARDVTKEISIPARSKGGSDIIAVSPGKFSIALLRPPLGDAGNSARTQRAIAATSNTLSGTPLAAQLN